MDTQSDKGFLYIAGTRVFVTGTRHHGFRGVVIGSSNRRMLIVLDEWPGKILPLYRHNLIPEWQLP